MTESIHDYAGWAAFMRARRGLWTVDAVHDGEDGRRLLCHCAHASDPTRGVYVEIDERGVARAGTFEDAIPHVGDALFRVRWERDFGSRSEALRVVTERLGVPFLFAVLGFV